MIKNLIVFLLPNTDRQEYHIRTLHGQYSGQKDHRQKYIMARFRAIISWQGLFQFGQPNHFFWTNGVNPEPLKHGLLERYTGTIATAWHGLLEGYTGTIATAWHGLLEGYTGTIATAWHGLLEGYTGTIATAWHGLLEGYTGTIATAWHGLLERYTGLLLQHGIVCWRDTQGLLLQHGMVCWRDTQGYCYSMAWFAGEIHRAIATAWHSLLERYTGTIATAWHGLLERYTGLLLQHGMVCWRDTHGLIRIIATSNKRLRKDYS